MIEKYRDKIPEINKSCFVHEKATIIGGVKLEEKVSVWPNAVLRGDGMNISIGRCSNVQDCCVLHGDSDVIIGEYVSIGHSAIIHGAEIGDSVIVGMGAIVLDGSKIGKNSIIGAGTLVTGNKVFEDESLIMGSPAKCIRKLTKEEIIGIRENAETYLTFLEEYTK